MYFTFISKYLNLRDNSAYLKLGNTFLLVLNTQY